MKSKLQTPELEAGEGRRGGKLEFSPVRTSAHGRSSNSRVNNRTSSTGKRTCGSGASPSPGPGRTSVGSSVSPSPGPGRTPQTKRRELSLTAVEKNSPTGSPRNVNKTQASGNIRKTGTIKSKSEREVNQNSNSEESSRKSSNSSQDSGIGREPKLSRVDRPRSGNSVTKSGRTAPIIRTISPEIVDLEVSNRKKFEELCDLKNIELGIVKVPRELLEDLIHKENIEKYYDVDPVPVASGLFATVRKCTHKDTGVEYAAKFSSRTRCGVDCTTEVLHEIALLSICAESNKIVHLKDVFQNKHEIVLVLEYAPGGDFQSVLDDDMVPFEQDVQGFMLQLLEAISYVHERKIAHLDIKPQNIVLMSEFPNCEIKLCDLEVSRVIQENEEIREIIGTPDYVAPEILAYEPISLAADIWSLGVLAYVLLTGFSPFGGDTDQETLRNIASAKLDFPAELFEGVSEDAKEFIADCLNRNPKSRPTVQQCLEHPWIAQNSEPPSPSPLMLKIPAPDHFVTHQPTPKLSVHSPSGSSRRSCQTCRDKLTERKRYLSKSREAIFEKVSNSNLKKSLSKSRERLCDMRLTLSKSRDFLNESKPLARSQEKFYSFKSLSKSQEVLSQALGGNMKRINGAVSDISPQHLPINPRVYLDTPDSCDFVILPGSTVLMSHSELMSISGSKNSGSLQLLPISESGRSTPASQCSNVTVADIPYSEPCNDHPNNAGCATSKSVVETLVEVSEEDFDEEDNKTKTARDTFNEAKGRAEKKKDESIQASIQSSNLRTGRRKSIHETSMTRTFKQKEEKNNLNYETKQSMSRSASVDGINNRHNNNNNNHKLETAEVAVQVNLTKCTSSPDIMRKKVQEIDDENVPCSKKPELICSYIPVDGNIRPGPQNEKKLTRGFSHDDTLGDDQKRYSWREELERFRSMKKPLGVSDLIDAFSNKSTHRKVSSDDPSFPSVDSLISKRRGSLQIQIDPKALAKLTETAENEKAKHAIKLQRRKSTSAIIPLRLSEVKMPDIDEDGVATPNKSEESTIENAKDNNNSEKAVSEEESVEDELNIEGSSESINTPYVNQSLPKGRVYLEKVNERKRTWDYFEINHPKAISDKKLEQLKAKYTRRKTEAAILSQGEITKDKNANEKRAGPKKDIPPPLRTLSMPIIEGIVGSIQPKKSLELAWDPLTGECLSAETESVDSGQDSEGVRKLSSDSSEESSCSRKSSKSSRRKSSHLGDIVEADHIIPESKVLECFIDPFTGQFITNEVSKHNGNEGAMENKLNNKKNLKVTVSNAPNESNQQDDDGIGSLPNTPTDLGKIKSLSISNKPIKSDDADSIPTDDGIYTSSEEVIIRTSTNTDGHDSVSDNVSDQLSMISSEDSHDLVTSTKQDANGNIRTLPGSPLLARQRSNSGAKELALVSKVCTGSFSRGIEKFKGESPTPVNSSESF